MVCVSKIQNNIGTVVFCALLCLYSTLNSYYLSMRGREGDLRGLMLSKEIFVRGRNYLGFSVCLCSLKRVVGCGFLSCILGESMVWVSP